MPTAAAAESDPVLSDPSFASASPATVRAALIPEDAARFDRRWREVMAAATESFDLTEVHRVLAAWRRVALLTHMHGPDGYREILARAEQRLRTGEVPTGGMTMDQVKAMIAERLSS